MEKHKLEYYLERKDVIERYFRGGLFVDAEREVLRLKKVMEEDADVPKDLLSDVYYKLYHLAWIREDKENAFKFAEKAVELHPIAEGKLQIYSNLATNALQRNLLDESNLYVEKCIGLLSENTPNAWYVYYLKGKIQLKKGEQKAALEEFTSSAKEANRMHQPYGEIAATIYVAEVLFQLGLKHNALSEIVRIEMYAKRTRQLQQYLRVLIKKAQLLYRIGRKDEAEQVVLTIPEFDD